MLVKNDKGIFVFEKFLAYPEIVHGFSTRSFGTIKTAASSYLQSVTSFAQKLGIDSQDLIRMNQMHTAYISWVTIEERGQVINNTDGLLTSDPEVFLGVATADCIPFLLYNPDTNVVGAVHAGWRGMVQEIIDEAIQKMVKKGSNVRDIIVGIGPSIRSCCYEFGEEEIELIQKKFPQWDDFVITRDEKLFLDLPTLAYHQLQAAGILEENIEDGKICTADNLDEFYSYRKEKDLAGRFMGVIGRV